MAKFPFLWISDSLFGRDRLQELEERKKKNFDE
jgi:hypothetical protein